MEGESSVSKTSNRKRSEARAAARAARAAGTGTGTRTGAGPAARTGTRTAARTGARAGATPAGGKGVATRGGDGRAPGGTGRAPGKGQEKPIFDALGADTGRAVSVGAEKPPIPDPIAAGELPDKLGRVGRAKGGRPRGSAKEEKAERARMEGERERAEHEAKARETAGEISGLFVLVFHLVAVRLGAHWELTAEESDRLAYRFARVEQKWGGFLDKYAPEFALVGCAATILYPRLVAEAEKTDGKPVEAEVIRDADARAAS
jgi:hypothetical protein